MGKYGEPIQSHLYATQVDVDFDMQADDKVCLKLVGFGGSDGREA